MNKKCKVCGREDIHLGMVEVIMGDQVITISGKNDIKISEVKGNSARGVILHTTYSCENGHSIVETETFHKGVTISEIGVIPKLQMNVMWRD